MADAFKTLNVINVNENTEKKNGLTYLSWAWAWSTLKQKYPDATYQIRQFEGKPYLYDENLGYMVMTEMTVDGITHEMWLPVMDASNKAMKSEPYSYEVKEYKNGRPTGNLVEKWVSPATMFDINTAIMRCLTKNIAMFGLGLYIYAGEDLPEETEEQKQKAEEQKQKAEEQKQKAEEQKQKAEDEKKSAEIGRMKIAPVKVQVIKKRCADDGVPEEKVLKLYKINCFEDMTENQFRNAHDNWQKIKEM